MVQEFSIICTINKSHVLKDVLKDLWDCTVTTMNSRHAVYEEVLHDVSGTMRKDYRNDLKTQKREAHRKQIKINESEKATHCNYQFILGDNSKNK